MIKFCSVTHRQSVEWGMELKGEGGGGRGMGTGKAALKRLVQFICFLPPGTGCSSSQLDHGLRMDPPLGCGVIRGESLTTLWNCPVYPGLATCGPLLHERIISREFIVVCLFLLLWSALP